MSLLAAAALSALLPLGAGRLEAAIPAGRDSEVVKADIRKVKAEIAELEAGCRKVLDEMRAMTAAYPEAPDLPALESRRQSLAGKHYDFKYGINVKLGVYRNLRKELQWSGGANLLARMAAQPEENVAIDVAELVNLTDSTDPVIAFLDEAEAVRKADEAAFAGELTLRAEEKRQRRLRTQIAGGAGALAVLGAGVVFLFRRFRRKDDAVLAKQLESERAQWAALKAVRAAGPKLLEAGAVLGENYRIESRLDETPFGPVFAAVELGSSRPVLLTRMRDELHRSDKGLDLLLERARQAAALKHRNLAELLAVFLEGERLHLVYERVDGRPVGDFLAEGRPVRLPAIKLVLTQTIKAVHHAHEKGLLHGDLTPSAIVVTAEGVVKVMGFAVAAEARKAAGKFSYGQIFGTPAYMAPEQELGASFKESDFYSLGVILYEMATGQKPFPGPNFLEQKRSPCPPPSAAVAGLPKELDLVVQRALQLEPQRRFRDALDLLEAVEGIPEPR